MSSYRDLNKELITQVQTMRIDLKLYCDEIVNLKGELMQKHETEVMLRKECYAWALESFIQLIQTVQPDSDILSVLKEYWQPQGTISSAAPSLHTSRNSQRTRTSGERSPVSIRSRSSQLTAEFQRSNSVLNTRKSICNTSPIQRSSNEATEEEQEVESVAEDQEEEPQAEEEDCENDSESVTKEPEENLNVIYEGSEKEEEDEELDDETETVYESVEDVSVDDISITKTRSTLKDVTNMVIDTTDCSNKENSPVKVVHRRGRPKKHKKTSRETEQENLPDDDSDMEQCTLVDRPVLANKSDTTLQEPRRHSNARHASMRNKSIPITVACNQTCEEVTLASNTSVYTDLTLRNFKDAACSTPNSRHNSLRKPTTPPTFTTSANSNLLLQSESVTNNLSCRPSRQCKPKDLAEPKLRTKLRNESKLESVTKKKSRSKTRTKKKT